MSQYDNNLINSMNYGGLHSSSLAGPWCHVLRDECSPHQKAGVLRQVPGRTPRTAGGATVRLRLRGGARRDGVGERGAGTLPSTSVT